MRNSFFIPRRFQIFSGMRFNLYYFSKPALFGSHLPMVSVLQPSALVCSSKLRAHSTPFRTSFWLDDDHDTRLQDGSQHSSRPTTPGLRIRPDPFVEQQDLPTPAAAIILQPHKLDIGIGTKLDLKTPVEYEFSEPSQTHPCPIRQPFFTPISQRPTSHTWFIQ